MDHYDRIFGNPGYLARRIAADISGPAAIPRRNGEPLFNEPWESRVFGAAVALCERGTFEWDEFRERLIAEIATGSAKATEPAHPPATYYEHFLAALERLLIDKGICDQAELSQQLNSESLQQHHHD